MKRVRFRSQRGFSLIEILTVIAIIAILAAILFPVFATAKDQAKKAASISNVNQLVKAHLLYANEHDNVFAPLVIDTQQANAANGTDYQASWMSRIDPYAKDRSLYFSPGGRFRVETGKRESVATYAMLPRWRFYAGADPTVMSQWQTGYGNALMDGIGGYSWDTSIASPYYGFSGCNAAPPADRVIGSMAINQVARQAETALIFDAEGWEYGFMCTNAGPWPIDAVPPATPYSGINFAGRYNPEGVKQVNSVPYKIGTGAVAFVDGHAAAFKTAKFFETTVTQSGMTAYRYQYSRE